MGANEQRMETAEFAMSPDMPADYMERYNIVCNIMNRYYHKFAAGLITASNFTELDRKIIADAMKHQCRFKFGENGKPGIIEPFEMIEGRDYVIESRNGEFGMYSLIEDE